MMTDAERRKAFEKARSVELKARAALLAQTREDVIKLLEEALAEIKTLLADAPTEYEMYRLPLLQKQIEQTLVTFGNHSAEALAQGAARAWAGGQALVVAPLEAAGFIAAVSQPAPAVLALSAAPVEAAAMRVVAKLPQLDTRMLMAMSNFMTDRIKNVSQEAAAKINAQLGMVLIGAQTPGEAASKIDAILGGESRARALTITHTELARVYAVAAQQQLEKEAARVPGLKKQWRKSGKKHSRFNHDMIDGQVRAVDKPFDLVGKDGLMLAMMYPHDPKAPAAEVVNCGCLSIPYKASWKMSNPGSLPNYENAVIEERKLVDYALNPEHEVGGSKARRFKAALGYDAANAQDLAHAIRAKLSKGKAIGGLADKHGQRYAVDMELTGPAGKAVVRTAWIAEGDDEIPRLVSVYVKES